MKNILKMLIVALVVAVPAAAHEGHEAAVTLKAGRYTATVKALVCGACAPEVKKTVASFPGVRDVVVDKDKSVLSFSVKKGKSINVAKLQAALKAASDKMGMGADYSLNDIEPAAKPAASQPGPK